MENLSEFDSFFETILEYGKYTKNQFNEYYDKLSKIYLQLDNDPTINLANFYEKLKIAQDTKSIVIDVMMGALSIKASWQAYVSVAEKYLREFKSNSLSLVKDLKNKDLQEAKIYSLNPKIFDCYNYCESMLDYVETMLKVFDLKLDLVESFNLNINRQITVTELLSYKGLL